jgi:2-polyprenyl-6-methoxyphenol hydroxylase-like FAD-dependent oxidoreductase
MNTQPHRTAIVLGASIAGLLAARALSASFQEVLLIERGELPDHPAPRPNVPQGRHGHGLLAGGIESLERLLPGLVGELEAQGCQSGDNLRDVSWIFGGKRLAVGDSGVPGLAVARPLLEHSIRARVLGLGGVRIRTSARVVGLLVERMNENQSTGGVAHRSHRDRSHGTALFRNRPYLPLVSDGRVTGVRVVTPDGTAETMSADLVVDAMGRTSPLPEFLEQAGYARPQVDEVALETHYVSRTFRRTTAHASFGVGVLVVASPEVPRGGTAFAIQEDVWLVSQYAFGTVHPPLDTAAYRDFARTLAAPELARLIDTSEPLDEPATMKFRSSRRYRYEELRRFPDRLFVCGDSIASFNPTFGQGITVAALQAGRLERMGAGVTAPGANRRFLRDASAVVDLAWNTAAGRSFTFDGVQGQPTPRMRLSNAYLPLVIARGHRDVAVATALMRAIHFLAPPTSLLAPSLLAKVLL